MIAQKAKEHIKRIDWVAMGLFCSFMALKKRKPFINQCYQVYVIRYFALISCSFVKRKKNDFLFPTQFVESMPRN